MTKSVTPAPIEQLLDIMAQLRNPEGGCPWDLEQNFETIAPHTIEEAYEVAEAIAKGDMAELKDELDTFVFGQTTAWEETKARERALKREASDTPPSALDGVASNLPALTRAVKLQNRAGRVGFDWPSIRPVFEKIEEEMAELRVEIDNDGSEERIAEEYGDLLFVMANLGRHLKLEPETVLRSANRKFTRRFQTVEQRLTSKGKSLDQCSLEEMDDVWNEIRKEDKS